MAALLCYADINFCRQENSKIFKFHIALQVSLQYNINVCTCRNFNDINGLKRPEGILIIPTTAVKAPVGIWQAESGIKAAIEYGGRRSCEPAWMKRRICLTITE